MRCKGTTTRGTRCKRQALDGTKFCKEHTDQANKLTPEQEAFCYHYVYDANSAAHAWITSHPESKAKMASIYVRASELLNQRRIQVRISEIRLQLLGERRWSKERSIERLAEIALDSTRSSLTACVSAIKELDRLHGFGEPDRLDITTGGDKLPPAEITTIDPIEAARQYAAIMTQAKEDKHD